MRDIDIRSYLKHSLLNKFYHECDTKVVEELSVCQGDARVDIAVINGALHGFEIKSQFDSLSRLPNQLAMYSKTFDYLTVVAAEKHADRLQEILPDWCGILLVPQSSASNSKFILSRKAQKNSGTEKYSIAQLLWKAEVIDLLEDLGISKGLKNKSKPALWALLANATGKGNLAKLVRAKLKSRANWKSALSPFENDDYLQSSAM